MKKWISLFISGVLSLGLFACKNNEDVGQVCVYMPDGAPALAMAKLLIEDTESDGISYRVVNPAIVKTKVTGGKETDNADFCVLPLTAGCKLLGSGENYKLLATLTHGNLFMVSNKNLSFTADNLPEFVGKTVGVLQLKEVPGLTFKTALQNAEIPFVELANGVSPQKDKVNLRPITSAGDLATVEADCYLLAQPAVSAVLKKGYTLACDLQALFGGGFPQAVLVAKTSFIEKNVEFTRSFLTAVEESCQALLSLQGSDIVSAVTAHLEDNTYQTTLKANILTADTLGKCGVRYLADCKTYVMEYMQAVGRVDDTLTMPSEYFFWS